MLGRNVRGRQSGRATEHLLHFRADLLNRDLANDVPVIVLVLLHTVALEELQMLAQEFERPIRDRSLVDVFAGRIAVSVPHRLGLHGPLDILDQAPQHPLVIQVELFGLGRATEE